MTYPKISIVTPSFNQGKYIEQTILSVFEQDYPNLEYIIIDGGSTDETIEIIKKYERHISYWTSEPDKGQTDAINKGFAKCTGDIFNWINSDDYYEPGVFKKLGAYFIENASVNVVCGKEWAFNDTNLDEKILNPGSVIKTSVFETIRIGIIDQPCTFFRKKAIDAFFPLDVSLQYVMDRQLWWSYLLKYGQENILETADVFTNFRIHSQSKSIAQAELFEIEFDKLKLALFRQLQAPKILEKQLHTTHLPPDIKWQINIMPVKFILSAFATYYSERQYVKKNLHKAGILIGYVKKWKRFQLSKNEWRLWLMTNIIPHAFLRLLKQIKTSF